MLKSTKQGKLYFQNNRFYWNSSSSANKNSARVNVPTSTLPISQGHEVNAKNASAKIPISMLGPQHSTSPLLSSDATSGSSTVKRNNDGNSKLFKFSSNALRF